jgi:hypothetical protein
MKRLITLILLFFSIHSFAQNWADSGATWHYGYSVFSIEGFVELTYEGDTLMQGIEAKKIAKRLNYINLSTGEVTLDLIEGYEYMYADSDRVYQLIDDQFEVLYDFSVQTGDTVLVYNNDFIEDSVNCDSVGRSFVTATGVEVINGEELRWYTLENVDGSSYNLEGKIIEKIGNSESYMFSSPNCTIWEEVI